MTIRYRHRLNCIKSKWLFFSTLIESFLCVDIAAYCVTYCRQFLVISTNALNVFCYLHTHTCTRTYTQAYKLSVAVSCRVDSALTRRCVCPSSYTIPGHFSHPRSLRQHHLHCPPALPEGIRPNVSIVII